MRASKGFSGTLAPSPAAAAEAAMMSAHYSAWRSPVPYLFGGLAAMLGLIALALLILACSYWKLSGFLESGDEAESEPSKPNGTEKMPAPARYEERFVVIMAGEENPRYLATPVSSRASSFGDNSAGGSSTEYSGSGSGSGDDGDDDRKKRDDVVVIEAEILRSSLPEISNRNNQEQ